MCSSDLFVDIRTAVHVKPNAFRKCVNMTTVISTMVMTVDFMAFFGCKALDTFDFNSTVTVGDLSFFKCAFTHLRLRRMVDVGCQAFSTNSKLLSLRVPVLQNCSASAWSICKALGNVYAPSLVGLGIKAFFGCTHLNETNFKFSDTLARIGTHAFGNTAFTTVLLAKHCYVHKTAFGEEPIAISSRLLLRHRYYDITSAKTRLLTAQQRQVIETMFIVERRLLVCATRELEVLPPEMWMYCLSFLSYEDMLQP